MNTKNTNKNFLYFLASVIVGVYSIKANSSSHHEAKINSLVPHLVNLVTLLSFIIYKLKKPLQEYFSNLSETVQSLLAESEKNFNEAKKYLKNSKEKIGNLVKEKSEIERKIDLELKNFEKKSLDEINEKMKKMEKDAVLKIESEKRQILKNLETEIIEKVLDETKSTFVNDSLLKQKASKRVLELIQ